MIQITYIQAILYIVGSFTAGAVLVALITASIRRGITVSPVVNVTPPEVHLPETLNIVTHTVPSPETERGALWKQVYDMTLDAGGYPSSSTDVEQARSAADAAVKAAYREQT